MKNVLVDILRAERSISGYRITDSKTESYELFFVHRSLETVRATDTNETSVTVYVEHDGKLGDATFTVYGSMSDEEIKEKIAAAAERAKLVFNEPYELPADGCGNYELESNLGGDEPRVLAAKIADAVFDADCVEGGSINATEIFLYRDTVRVMNSRGIDKTQVKYRAMIEAIPTFTDSNESVELYEAYRFTEFNAAAVTAEISEKMREVALRRKAVKPATPIEADVVLRGQEIDDLMSALAYDLTYAGVYVHSNLHKKGDVIQTSGSGDRLSLSMTARLRGSSRSAFFDGDGVKLADTALIEDGRVVGYFGSHRFASYLGEPETGELRCMTVASGTLTDAELDAMPHIECVSLSGLQVDLYNDYIGGEIRLAYRHADGKAEPITGITMSAKLSEVLDTMRLSERIEVRERCAGPARLLLRGVKIM